MIEVPKLDNSILDNQLIKRRHHTLLENDFEQQYDIDYLHPNYTFEETPIRTDLFIKSNIELTKDIYPASVNLIIFSNMYLRMEFLEILYTPFRKDEFTFTLIEHLKSAI